MARRQMKITSSKREVRVIGSQLYYNKTNELRKIVEFENLKVKMQCLIKTRKRRLVVGCYVSKNRWFEKSALHYKYKETSVTVHWVSLFLAFYPISRLVEQFSCCRAGAILFGVHVLQSVNKDL